MRTARTRFATPGALALCLAGAAAMAALAFSTPAEAGDRHRDGRRDHRSERHHRNHDRDDDSSAYGHRGRRPDHRGHRGHRGHDRNGGHHAHGQARYGYDYRHVEPRHHRHDRFEIPHFIRHELRRSYRPYFHGNVYYAPHRHSHLVYHFPVHTAAGYAYRPHYYCEGRLHGQVAYRGPRVSFGIRF